MNRLLRVLLVVISVPYLSMASADLTLFACEPEWAALAEELGGDHVSIYTATTARQDPHHIQARPSLIARLRNADLAVCTGAELEIGWMPMLQRQAGNPRIVAGQNGEFEAAMQVERLEVPDRVDRSMGDVHAAGNPHVQLDPRRILIIAEALSQRLQTVDPGNKQSYAAAYTDFASRWQAAMQDWQSRAGPLHGVRAVTHHKDWAYLFDWLGMVEVGNLEAKPGVPPSAAHLAALKQQLQQQPVRMVIRAAYQDSRPGEWLAEQTGIPVVVLPFTVGGDERATDLFGLFDDSIDRLLAALR